MVVLLLQTVIEAHGLKADEWVKQVSKVIGGKAGGKPQAAQGCGDNFGKVPEAMEIAKAFALLKLS